MKFAAVALLLFSVPMLAQQSQTRQSMSESLAASSEHKGAWDFGVWVGGGHRVAGGFRNGPFTGVRSDIIGNVSLVDLGFRIGKILTAEHGSGWFRGNLEYAVDLI